MAENQVPTALSTNLTHGLLGRKARPPSECTPLGRTEEWQALLWCVQALLSGHQAKGLASPCWFLSQHCRWCHPRESLCWTFLLFSDWLLMAKPPPTLHLLQGGTFTCQALYSWPSVHSTGPFATHEALVVDCSTSSPSETAASLHTPGGAVVLLPQAHFDRRQPEEQEESYKFQNPGYFRDRSGSGVQSNLLQYKINHRTRHGLSRATLCLPGTAPHRAIGPGNQVSPNWTSTEPVHPAQRRAFGTDKLQAVSLASHPSRLQLCKHGRFYVVCSFYNLFAPWILVKCCAVFIKVPPLQPPPPPQEKEIGKLYASVGSLIATNCTTLSIHLTFFRL